RCLSDAVIVDGLQCLPKSEAEKCQLVGRRWRNLANAHMRSLPLRRVQLRIR
ncbi:hypothetical protein AAVH_35907, partial [Aphelenchoides avenae]